MDALDNLKNELKLTTVAQLGSFGEHLLERCLAKKGIRVKKVHRNGVDFLVDGVGSVDLKTQKNLNSNYDGKIMKYRYQLDGVIYWYMQLCMDKVVLLVEEDGLKILEEIDWQRCSELVSQFHFKRRNQGVDVDAAKLKGEIKEWVYREWGLDARVVSRRGKKAQDSFENNGWGPNNFYTQEKSRQKFNLVLCLYIEQGNVYKLFAYPMDLIDEIAWLPKNKGPNQNRIMIFDPRVLNSRFIFRSVEEFKDEYLERMALCEIDFKLTKLIGLKL
jgi:hypothetical protein